MNLWKPWKPQLNREFLSLVSFQVLRELNEILTKFLTLVHANTWNSRVPFPYTFSVLKTTIFFHVRFHTKMKQSTPWNEILSAFKLVFHPGQSACQPSSKEIVSFSTTTGLKGHKMDEWEMEDESFNDSLVF